MRLPYFLRGLRTDVGGLRANVAEVHAGVSALLSAVKAMRTTPAPFVCLWGEAMGPHGPTTFGTSGRVRARTVLEMQTHLPLKDVRLTVFADFERVDIRAIFLGIDVVTAQLGTCPVARFSDWPPGVLLRVQCELRPDDSRGA